MLLESYLRLITNDPKILSKQVRKALDKLTIISAENM